MSEQNHPGDRVQFRNPPTQGRHRDVPVLHVRENPIPGDSVCFPHAPGELIAALGSELTNPDEGDGHGG